MRTMFPAPETYPAEFTSVHSWPVPAGIRIEGGALVCEPLWPEQFASARWQVNPKGRLLPEFCDLCDAPDTELERFAREYGLLGLCRVHAMPAGEHNGHRCQPAWREPLPAWRDASRYISALLNLGRAMPVGDAGDDADWRLAMAKSARARGSIDPMETYLIALDTMVRRWAQLHPILVFDREFRLAFGGRSYAAALPAAIGYQALAWLLGAKAILICSGCGQLFESQRARDPERRAFCPNCGHGAAMRAASRAYYKRKREKEQ